MQSGFVHLRSRSPYSILEGALRIDETADICRRRRMPALALTDTNNLCGALEFSDTMVQAGVQPIIGLTLSVDLELDMQPGQSRKDPDGTLVLLAQNQAGYENLMEISSRAFLDVAATDLPHLPVSKLEGLSEGMIALTGGPDGALNRLICQGRLSEAGSWLDRLAALFPDRLYVELQRHGTEAEKEAEPHLIRRAYDKHLPLVATNEPYFLEPAMYKAHDALLAIAEGSYVLEKNRRKLTGEHYFKSEQQMLELFSDVPEACANTLEIAQRCACRAQQREPILPRFGDETTSEAGILAEQARAGLEVRLESVPLAAKKQDYFDRLDVELGIIEQMGFPGYFLIVSDFIKWAKARGIPVGPGRGSGAGSVVAWALTITDLDPLRYGLLFERFLNPERISMPDFDIDFCQERRSEVIRYVQDKYGDDQVAHIITFGTLQPRAVVRDVGRVLQIPLGQVDRLAKLIPNNPADPVTLREAIEIEKDLQDAREGDPDVRELLTIALQLEGLYRNASTHAAGVVIGDRKLTRLVPLYRDPRSDIPATQFSMKWAEKAGLVKFDFLGLKTLTVIDRAVGYLSEQGISVDFTRLDTKTPRAYEVLAEGLSAGVFQLESSGMRDALRKMAPDSIEELTALISLYRPGPMKNIDTYIDRKFGRVEVRYPHPKIAHILKETYGIIIYQEQVMQIAQVLSGYTPGEADILRRAMSKKDKKVMTEQKNRFVDGAVERGVDAGQADHIFELVSEFAGYGFNKSHAAAYAVISFQTAYLKAFHPAEFMAAVMSLDINNVEKLAQFYQESGRMGVAIKPPSINRSYADFKVLDGAVLYALGALKNVGLEAMRHVVEVRDTGGPFTDLFDFARRVDMRLVNKRAIENLARSGAFDELEPNRARVLEAASQLQAMSSRAQAERQSAQNSLFGDTLDDMDRPEFPDPRNWSHIEQLDHELGAVGFYIGGHPLDSYRETLEAKKTVLATDIDRAFGSGRSTVNMAGVVRKRQERMSRHGQRFAYLALSDPSGDYEAFVGSELLARHGELLTPGSVVQIAAKLEERDGEVKVFTQSVNPLAFERKRDATGLKIRLRSGTEESLDMLNDCLVGLRESPTGTLGAVEVIIPLGPQREGCWKLRGRLGIDKSVQKAIKSLKFVESVKEIAA